MTATFVRDDQIQAAIVALLKSKTAITSLLTTSNEIRENEWKGTEFVYPNIRVRMSSNIPSDNGCMHEYTASILVFSEQASSQQADIICGTIGSVLNNRQFTSSNVHLSVHVTNVVPAIAVSERVWQSEIMVSGIASNI